MTSKKKPGRPQVWSHLSTSSYVSSFDRWAKESLPNYSRRAFAKWAKIASPNALTLVIQGKRALSKDWLGKFSTTAKLSEAEAKYLQKLWEIEQSKNSEEQSRLFDEAIGIVSKNADMSLAGDTLQLIANPQMWTLFHLLDLNDVEQSPKGFKERLLAKNTSAEEILNSLKTLLRLKLIEKDQHGNYRKLSSVIESPDQMQAAQNSRFHKFVLDESLEFLNERKPEERAFSSLTIAVPKELISEFKKEANLQLRKILQKYSKEGAIDGELFRINLQLYPLTKKND